LGNITLKDFVNNVLKQYHKSLYEWQEDVVRPKLLMNKLCQGRVTVTPEDLQHGFEAYFGEKVVCRIILWPLAEKAIAEKMYDKIRQSDEEFLRAARQQPTTPPAPQAGRPAQP